VIGGFDTKYTKGEILLPPGSRADVVVAIPDTLPLNSALTLWTRDFSRTGGGFSMLPTVPVMHLKVIGAVVAPAYTINGGVDGVGGTALRASIAGAAVEPLLAATGALLDPTGFVPTKKGRPNPDIQVTTALTGGGPPTPSIDGVKGSFEDFVPYTAAPHIDSSRYAKQGDTLELTVTNTSNAHHPFHLHGFSFQPISLTQPAFSTYTWPYREFRDNVDVPANYTLKFRVRLDDRELVDGITAGGALGRWLFHCHIFFHHHQGMISELVVTAPDGSEKPDVDVGGSWAYTPSGGIAERHGTFFHRDGDPVTLTASRGTVTDTGGGSWSWSLDSTGLSPTIEYVYITATDTAGRRDQAVFRLKIGAPDDGADNGDPHVHTVDGKSYDFQGVGEFILLRDAEGMEVQARHWPVETANPVTDPNTGLTSCVSVNTAVAARVGRHRISYQPGRDGTLEFYLNGKRASLPREGMDLDTHRLSAFAVEDGVMGLRVDYASQAVLAVTPYFWESQNIWILNVSVSHTHADEGIMGRMPPGAWLPALPDGTSVGSMPATLHERYVALYKKFANAWRVSNETSLFVYAPGTSTKTFTDVGWPAEKPPCKLKPAFRVPGATVSTANIPIPAARKICRRVGIDELHRDCVFDVATTGDERFAKIYEAEQKLRLHATSVQIVADKLRSEPGEPLTLTATVLPLQCARPTPTGSVAFSIDGVPAGSPVMLDKRGRASFVTARLQRGQHIIRATYGGGRQRHRSCSSPNLVNMVGKTERPHPPTPHGGHI
jgi:hypothetical protein